MQKMFLHALEIFYQIRWRRECGVLRIAGKSISPVTSSKTQKVNGDDDTDFLLHIFILIKQRLMKQRQIRLQQKKTSRCEACQRVMYLNLKKHDTNQSRNIKLERNKQILFIRSKIFFNFNKYYQIIMYSQSSSFIMNHDFIYPRASLKTSPNHYFIATNRSPDVYRFSTVYSEKNLVCSNQNLLNTSNPLIQPSRQLTIPTRGLNFHLSGKSQKINQSRTNKLQNINNNNLTNFSLVGALYVISKALSECMTVHQTYGHSNFELQKCLIDEGGKLICHQAMLADSEKGNTDELKTVVKIIESVKNNCFDSKFEDFYSFFKRAQSCYKCNLKYTISLVKSYCKCGKITEKNNVEYSQRLDEKLQKGHVLISRVVSLSGQSISSRERKKRNTLHSKDSDSFLKFHKSTSKERDDKRKVKKSAEIANINKISFGQKNLTKSNQIPRKLKISSSKLVQANRNKIKESQSTADHRTSIMNTSIKNDLYSVPRSKTYQIPKFIPEKQQNSTTLFSLPLVQESDNQNRADHSRHKKSSQQEFDLNIEEEFYQKNNWIKKIENLSVDKKSVVQSFIEGKDRVRTPDKNRAEKLGRFARTMAESFLQQDSSR